MISPVDRQQVVTGLGMAIATRYSKIVKPDGTAMTVREILADIYRVADEILAEGDEHYDIETRWAITWYETHGFRRGPAGDAETLAVGRAVSLPGLTRAGIIESGGRRVRLVEHPERPAWWSPRVTEPLSVWVAALRATDIIGKLGEVAAAEWAALSGEPGNHIPALATRLYRVAERRKWAGHARRWATLADSWPEILRLVVAAQPKGERDDTQDTRD